jgi:hypothetical protein
MYVLRLPSSISHVVEDLTIWRCLRSREKTRQQDGPILAYETDSLKDGEGKRRK